MYHYLKSVKNRSYKNRLCSFLYYLFLPCFICGCGNIGRSNIVDSNILSVSDQYNCTNKKEINTIFLDNLNNVFNSAAESGDTEFLNESLKGGISPSDLESTIHTKGCSCHRDVIKYLFIKYNEVDKYGNTQLHHAMKSNNVNDIENIFDNQKITSIIHHYRSIIINLGLKNYEGNTPFHLAAQKGYGDVIKKVLNKILSLPRTDSNLLNQAFSIENNHGLTFISLATVNGHENFLQEVFNSLETNKYTIEKYILQHAIDFAKKQISKNPGTEESKRIEEAVKVTKSYLDNKNKLQEEEYKLGYIDPSWNDFLDSFKNVNDKSDLDQEQNVSKKRKKEYTSGKPFACTECEKSFDRKIDLEDHIKGVHNKERLLRNNIVTCHICRRQFDRQYVLNIHIRTHTGERPFICNIQGCIKKFAQKEHLNRHIRTHTGEKPYPCNKCKERFIRKDMLKSHIAKIHASVGMSS